MVAGNAAEELFIAWYEGLPRYSGNFPARGTIGGALVVLERLKLNFDTRIDAHTARGGAQIIGASGAAVATILSGFGENRPFLSEGGRTNRGLRGAIEAMLSVITAMNLGDLTSEERSEVLTRFQHYLIERVRDFHNHQRLQISYNPAKSTWQFIRDLLDVARTAKKEGQVAQYLVGAKLALRFPEARIDNFTYSTADQQLGRPGDFSIGRTAFHVTVSPMGGVYERGRRNLEAGYAVYLLVPDRVVAAVKINADSVAPGQITVVAIESFVAQNLDELAVFGQRDGRAGLRALIETYNRRVDTIESDKSLLIDLPPNLAE